MCYPRTNKRGQLTTTSTHVTKLQELKTHISICHLNTQSMTSTFDDGQRIEIRHHHTIRNTVKERQTSFRICQFAWLQILLQKPR